MSLKVEKGVFASPGATGNQTISLADTGFGTVKALVVWATYMAAAGDSGADGILSVGFGTYRGGTPQQRMRHYFDLDGASTSDGAGGDSQTSIIRTVNEPVTPTVDMDAALVSLGNAQFVLNWTDLPTTSGIKIHYLVLGGTDITDALVSSFDIAAAFTGTQDVTVASGFGQPNLLLSLPTGNTTPGDGRQSSQVAFGAGIDDANEAHSAFQNERNRPSMEASSHQASTLAAFINVDTAMFYEVELSAKAAWPTDGFEVNVLTNNAATADVRVGYLALKGTFTAVIGSGTAPTAAAPQTQDLEVGQTPRGAIFFHNSIEANAAQDNSHADLGTFGLGATDGTSEGHTAIGQDDGNATSVAHRHHSESKSIRMFTPSASGTLASEADASFVGTAVRLTWDDTDTVAREYRYLLLGDGAGGTTYEKTGVGAAGMVGSGVSRSVLQESGAGTAGLVGSGASASVNQETGFGTVGGVGSGTSAFVSGAGNVYTKAGFGAVGTVGSGSSASVFVKAGAGIAGTVGSGAGARAGVIVKAGAGAAGTVGSGSSASVFQETGAGVAGTAGSGPSSSVFVESGFGKVGTVGSGSETLQQGVTYTKAGSGAAGLVAFGTRLRVLTREGVAVVTLTGSGGRNSVYGESGFATVNGDGYGVSDIDVFFTLLDPVYTGRVADTEVGMIDGREQGHVSDTVAGVVEEDEQEVFA